MSELTLVALGGLCNRLRAMLSAMALARDCGLTLRIVWLRDKGLNARFSDLFEPIAREDVIIEDSGAWWRYGVARRRNGFLPALYQRFAFDTLISEGELEGLIAAGTAAATLRERIKGRVLIQTGLGFYPCDDSELTRWFVPSAAVSKIIEERKQRITAHTVGLHIRRTDNTQAIAHSPLEAFEAAMRHDLERDPNTTFYIATDDPSVASDLTLRFPSSFFFNSAVTRSTVEGMVTAVAELYTLMACPRFHGSYWSSFSDMVVACHREGEADIIDIQKST